MLSLFKIAFEKKCGKDLKAFVALRACSILNSTVTLVYVPLMKIIPTSSGHHMAAVAFAFTSHLFQLEQVGKNLHHGLWFPDMQH